ncbi:hypothetical protein C2845_PM09G13670 [Panicum miliaceum]|uniref:Uncharacterized protein n=1 Tax=Panicum miliaceum TaxID=4540 RepID=A0A3L6RYH4_PANMI|nr:hypothetical protein C2845_PM09G13670 [Panicum miliaceum]
MMRRGFDVVGHVIGEAARCRGGGRSRGRWLRCAEAAAEVGDDGGAGQRAAGFPSLQRSHESDRD